MEAQLYDQIQTIVKHEHRSFRRKGSKAEGESSLASTFGLLKGHGDRINEVIRRDEL